VAVGPALALGQLSGEFMSTVVKLIPLFSAIVATITVLHVYAIFAVRDTMYARYA